MLKLSAFVCHMPIAEFPEADMRGGGEREPAEERKGEKDGILRGLKLALSCLFPCKDQSIATSVIQEHGGNCK